MAGNKLQMINITPFTGTGFSNWEFRVNLLLEKGECSDVLNTKCPPPGTAEFIAWNKIDVKARNIIVQCLADNMLEIIKTKATAKEIMETLSQTYTKKGISSQVMLQKKLRALKFEGESPLTDFLTEFEQTVCQLKAAGGKIENNEIVSQLLSAMPENYEAVVTAIDVLFCNDEDKVTIDINQFAA